MIRPVGPQDAGPVCALVQAGIETYRRFAPHGWRPFDGTAPEFVAQTHERFARPDAFGRVETGPSGAPEGVVFWRPPEPDRASRDGWMPDVHLMWLFVAEPRWGDGLADRLHGLAVAAMGERGHRRARLFTPRRHTRARRFYERRGWRRRLEPYRDEHMDLELVEYELEVGSAAV